MQLSEFPQAIYDAQQGLLEADLRLQRLNEAIANIKSRVDCSIVFDPAYKNDAQRACRRLELLAQDPTYLELENRLHTVQRQQKAYQIEVELLRNQFSVAKLVHRQLIAQLEVQA